MRPNADLWRGEFGTAYHKRQPPTDPTSALRAMVPFPVATVLEVGCGRGDNLLAWDRARVVGVEPNLYARELALDRGLDVRDDTADMLPFPSDTFDLVYTCGVLIHIGPDDLDASMSEIHRVSNQWILAVEYPAPQPLSVEYRGVEGGIWKRNYGAEYMDRFPLEVEGHGEATAPFEGCEFWLLRK